MSAVATQPRPQSHKRSMLDQEIDPTKFDTRTHLFDNQGRLVKKNLYTLYVVDGEQFYERPVSSGNIWYPNNLPAGRVRMEDGKRIFDHSAKHVTFVPKLDGHEAVEFELFQEKEKSAALEQELAQIKADFEARLAKLEAKPVAPAHRAEAAAASEAKTSASPRLRAEKDEA